MSNGDVNNNRTLTPPPKDWASRFATHAVTVGLSALIAWATTTYFQYEKSVRELESDKIKIIELVKDRQTSLALALIDYYQTKFGNQDTAYTTLLGAIADYINTASGEISTQASTPASQKNVQAIATTITPEFIRSQFFSASRRQYAESLVDTFKEAGNDLRSRIISVLLDSIIKSNEDAARRYRVNLYIALTFSLLPRAGLSKAEFERLEALKSTSEYKDKTFKLNVDNAISRQRST